VGDRAAVAEGAAERGRAPQQQQQAVQPATEPAAQQQQQQREQRPQVLLEQVAQREQREEREEQQRPQERQQQRSARRRHPPADREQQPNGDGEAPPPPEEAAVEPGPPTAGVASEQGGAPETAAAWRAMRDAGFERAAVRSEDADERREARLVGKVAQRRRMMAYLLAARAEPAPPPAAGERRVTWQGVDGAAERVEPRRRGRRSVAPVEASAFCLPPAAQAQVPHALEKQVPRPASPESVIELPLAAPEAQQVVATGVHVGSADPHGLCLDDDRVPRSRRAPTFSVSAHEPASTEELLERPVAPMNVPPRTELQPEAAASVDEAPPVVTSLAQLLRPEWLSRLRVWLRRTARCIRLAAKGDWRAARRMRPPDFWVSASASMTPGMERWVWDLRPLARGEPAVPVQRSSADGVQPPSAATVLAGFARVDASFADAAIVREVLDGVADDVQAPLGTFLCAPHSGALRFMAEAESRIEVGVEAGWSSRHDAIPFWPIRCDPYSIVDESERAGKPKFRLTNDHSWPPTRSGGGGEAPSLNGSMDRASWPDARMIRVREVAEAAAILQASGAPVAVGVLDVVAYYKQFGRQRAEHWRNGMLVESGFVVDERCCFGSAADAAKCCRVSNVIVHQVRAAMRRVDEAYPPRDPRVLAWLQQRRRIGAAAGAGEEETADRFACLHAVGMYVDDLAHASIDDALVDADGEPVMRGGVQLRRAQAHFEAAKAAFRDLGLEPTKEQAPSTSATLLGVELDLQAGTLKLTERKRGSYARQSRELARRRTCQRDELIELLGKLNFAATCYPRGRQWSHAPWRSARARYRASDGTVVLSSAARRSLLQWADELERPGHEGVPLARRNRFPATRSGEAAVIYADASGETGFGAWTVVGDELLYLDGEWSAEERELLICDLELAASTFGLVALQPIAAKAFVYSYTDNTVAMAAMRGLTPSTLAMQSLTAARVEWMLDHGVAEAAERVTSKANLWADLASRGRTDDVLRQAEALGLRHRRVDVPAEWRELLGELAAAACEGSERGGEGVHARARA
jgi:hypothetical protein